MTLASERIPEVVDPEHIVRGIAREMKGSTSPFCDRHIGGCTYIIDINGRRYTGRGNTEREAAWKLLASISERQASIESCL